MAIENTILNSISSIDLSESSSTNSEANSSVDLAQSGNSLPSMFAALLGNFTSESSTESGSDTSTSGELLTNNSVANLLSDENIGEMQQYLLDTLQRNLLDGLQGRSESESSNVATTQTELNVEEEEAQTNNMELFISSMSTMAFGEDGLDIQDGFNAFNVLNHVPIVSELYAQTNSTDLSSAASLAGSFIYGGTSGVLYSVADMAVEKMTGHSISNNLWNLGEKVFNGLSDYSAGSTSPADSVSNSAFAS